MANLTDKLITLKAIAGTLLQNPLLLRRVVRGDRLKSYVGKKYPGFSTALPVVDILDLFPGTGLDMEVAPYSYLNGTSSVVDIALLNLLAKSFKNCSYLEIGSFRGESIANVSRYAERLVSISLSESDMRRNEKASDEIVSQANIFSKDIENVNHITANSLSFNFRSLKRKFDLIFIDGDHRYHAVKSDTENAFQLLKNEHSVIVWHDYGLSPEHVRWDVLAGILDGTPDESRKYLFHVSNTLCAIFFKSKKIPTTRLKEGCGVLNKRFSVSIRAQRL